VLRRNTARLVFAASRKGPSRGPSSMSWRNEPVGTIEDLVLAMEAVHTVHVSETFTDQCGEVVSRTRNHPAIDLVAALGPASRSSRPSRARALIHGRNYVIPEDCSPRRRRDAAPDASHL